MLLKFGKWIQCGSAPRWIRLLCYIIYITIVTIPFIIVKMFYDLYNSIIDVMEKLAEAWREIE